MTDNWIESPQTANWDVLLDAYQNSPNDFYVETVKLMVKIDNYWKKLSDVIDLCPKFEIIIILGQCVIGIDKYQSWFRNTYNIGSSLILIGAQCKNNANKALFLRTILFEWNCIQEESMLNVIFSMDPLGWIDIREYSNVVDTLYQVIPDEIRIYFVSPVGLNFWSNIKRLQSVGMINSDHVNFIDDLIVNKLGLRSIKFTKPNLEQIMDKLGWKPLPEHEEQFDFDTITDITNIDELCYLTKPCKHDVTLLLRDGSTIVKCLTGPKIFELSQKFKKELSEKWISEHSS